MPRRRGPSVCVVVPTYNEAENVEPFVGAVLEQLDALRLPAAVLVVDDASPDGTGALADALARRDGRVHVLHRAGKEGLGRAYQVGLPRGAELGELVVQMDCDFSHDPAHLPDLIEAAGEADVVIGSRYVAGGAVVDWPWWRRIVSRGGSLYAQRLLGLPVRDLTGGFKVFRRSALERLDLAGMAAAGYGWQIETTHAAARAGLRVAEVPITFRDRTAGTSKMAPGIAREAARLVLDLRRRSRPADGGGIARRARTAAVAATGLALVLAAARAPAAGAHLALTGLFAVLTAIGATTLAWMLHAWRDAERPSTTAFPPRGATPSHAFSLIVPARHEEQVLPATLRRLARQDHPDFEVVVVVGDDDPGTRRAARHAIRGDRRFRVVVDRNPIKNKPKALNTALPYCRGAVVGVFDAEDQVAPGLLRAVDRRLEDPEVDVVQGAVQLMNLHSGWFAVRNVLEYWFWFRSRLHFHAEAGFIPLGGNTVFVRREVLLRAGGWDPECLTEDCELGARLSASGVRTAVAYGPELATREECPETLGALLRQRTRWNQGFLQVLRKDEWRRLPWRGRLLAAYTLAFPFVQAGSAVLLPLAILSAILLDLPTLLSLLAFLPLVPLATILVVEVVGLREFGRDFGVRPRLRDHAKLVAGTVPYQLLLSAAAARAAWRELRGNREWEKTAHVGAHL